MASYQKRLTKDGKIHWRVVVRRKGYPTQIATFPNKTEAKEWAQEVEVAIRNGKYLSPHSRKNHTVKEAIDRYLEKNLPPEHKQYPTKMGHLKWWKRELGDYALNRVTPSLLVDCRDKILQDRIQKKPRTTATVNRYMSTFSAMLTLASREWELLDENPMRKIKKLQESNGRERFLSESEIKRLLLSTQESKNDKLHLITVMALSTGMRQGEVLNLTWADLDFDRSKAILNITKNKERRVVPIPSHVYQLLKRHKINQKLNTLFVFPSLDGKRPICIRSAWNAALKRAGIEDFHFHDLRHTAASYLAMNGVSTQTIAEILGHKGLAMVQRYSHFSDDHLTHAVEHTSSKMFCVGDSS